MMAPAWKTLNPEPGAQTCGEAGIRVRPRTAGGRDAMLRAAAEAAVDAAMEQSGAQLGGMPPAAFITGLAGDLGVSPSQQRNQEHPFDHVPSERRHYSRAYVGWNAIPASPVMLWCCWDASPPMA